MSEAFPPAAQADEAGGATPPASEPAKPARSRLDAWRWILSLAAAHKGRLSVAAVSVILTTGISLVVPPVAGKILNAAVVGHDVSGVKSLIGGLIALFALRGVLVYAEVYAMRSAAAKILEGLRTRLHAHLMRLTPAFYETNRTGDLLSRLGTDIEQISSAVTDELIGAADRALALVGALAILLAMHTGLTLVMLLAVPPVIVIAVLFGMRLEKISKARQDAFAEAGVVAEESLSGVRTVQAFTREPEERSRYSGKIANATGLAIRAARAWGAFSGLVSFASFSALCLVIGRGGVLVARGELTPGDLLTFLLYTMNVAMSVGALTGLYATFKQALGSTEHVRELLDTAPRVLDAPDAKALPARAEGRVELRGVRFAYASAEGRPALRGLDLEAKPGEVVALVGPSGAGKSTVVNLVLRYYDADAGSVLLDGSDVKTLRLESLRAAIGLVPQEIFLFGGTIGDNIRYGRPGASDADVRAAAAAAQAAGFIERLPKAYDSVVGERGVRLSAGERQRIAIARVFLKDPSIIVLDEATSALDAESEHLVSRALERLMAGRTTLVVAHRLSTVRRATRVALVEAGRIADEGPHGELFARNALYRRLCELQMLAGTAADEATPAA